VLYFEKYRVSHRFGNSYFELQILYDVWVDGIQIRLILVMDV